MCGQVPSEEIRCLTWVLGIEVRSSGEQQVPSPAVPALRPRVTWTPNLNGPSAAGMHLHTCFTDRVSVYSPGWPQPLHSPAPALVLGFQAPTITMLATILTFSARCYHVRKLRTNGDVTASIL